MLEAALFFFGVSMWAPALDMGELATVTRTLCIVYFAVFLVAAMLALVFHGSIERRVMHHA